MLLGCCLGLKMWTNSSIFMKQSATSATGIFLYGIKGATGLCCLHMRIEWMICNIINCHMLYPVEIQISLTGRKISSGLYRDSKFVDKFSFVT